NRSCHSLKTNCGNYGSTCLAPCFAKSGEMIAGTSAPLPYGVFTLEPFSNAIVPPAAKPILTMGLLGLESFGQYHGELFMIDSSGNPLSQSTKCPLID